MIKKATLIQDTRVGSLKVRRHDLLQSFKLADARMHTLEVHTDRRGDFIIMHGSIRAPMHWSILRWFILDRSDDWSFEPINQGAKLPNINGDGLSVTVDQVVMPAPRRKSFDIKSKAQIKAQKTKAKDLKGKAKQRRPFKGTAQANMGRLVQRVRDELR